MYFIDTKEVLTEDPVLYAHTKKDGKELLEEHIQRCKKYFLKIYEEKEISKVVCRFSKKLGFHDFEKSFELIRKMLFQLIVFHDFGKCNPAFQNKKMGNSKVSGSYKGLSGTEHSFLSSIIYIDYFWNEIEENDSFEKSEKKILKLITIEHAYVIARHHSDLENFTDYQEKLKGNEGERLIACLMENPIPGYRGFRFLNQTELAHGLKRLYKGKNKLERKQYIAKYFYYRMAYSLLVASDYHATTEFMNDIVEQDIGKTLSIHDFRKAYNQSDIMHSIRKYEKEKYQGAEKNLQNVREMNDLRSEMFLDAERELERHLEDSIYFLEAPTGSGKSNTALQLSFMLMEQGKKLFYIYPFNTLVEQNRQTLQKYFSDKKLQEQIVVVNSLTPIGNSSRDEMYTTDYYQKVLLDRQFLNYPIILSTHVSFFNLLFGNHKEDVFGFFQLTDSVVVLDEIQSYRNTIWAEIIIFLKECAELMGMKIIIMSATLPNLEVLGGQECKVTYLLPNSEMYFQHPLFKKRVEISYELMDIEMSPEVLLNHIVREQAGDKKILVEFIKKNTAYDFYQMLLECEDINVPVKCITGDDSLFEREKILKPIKQNKRFGMILVSTQVIEAGVDIDMDLGYKNISILDSEEQFLGRINRSCKRSGKVYFFRFDNADIIYKEDYRKDHNFTLLSENMRQILLDKEFSKYYEKVLKAIKEGLNCSTGREGLEDFFINSVQKLNFIGVSDRMKLIADNTWNISVVLCRKLNFDDGTVLDGKIVWEKYKNLLCNTEMNYAEKQVKLSKIRSQLNYFVYQFKKNSDFAYNDILGELYCIYDGEQYFESGKLNRKKMENSEVLFI